MLDVPIVLASDINMIVPVFVTICSILEHRKRKYDIIIFIMVSDNETKVKGKEYADKLLELFIDFSITFIQIDDSIFKNVRDTMNYITKAAMYRLLIPDYLPQYNKCLYLDGDLYVKGDIIELMEQDVENNYIAGVLALFEKKALDKIRVRLNISDDTPYINSGVLVINLQKFRRDNMLKKFEEILEGDISKSFIMQDQDAINVCCQNKIKIIEPCFNVPLLSPARAENAISFLYSDNVETVLNEYQNPFILHYAGEWLKPWKCPYLKIAKEWWKSAQYILTTAEIGCMQKSAENNISKLFFSELLTKAKEAKDIVIFGFSEISNHLLEALLKNGINTVRGYCDNNIQKQGSFYRDVVCFSVEDASKIWQNAVYIISVQTRRKEIEKQLTKYGITESQIIQYIKKPEGLVELVEEEFKGRLIRDNALEESECCQKN